jgi:drug/metabolite transporter (DMT)-like permease
VGSEGATVLLALAAAAAWGAGDFGGGHTARRAPVLGVSLVVQPVGFIGVLSIALLRGEAAPEAGGVLLGVLAGIFGVTGLVNLYHGLAVGRMGVVAPVTGLLAATIPVVFGFVEDALPPGTVLVGIGIALAAVVLVSVAPAEPGRRRGTEFGLAAGLSIGLFNLLISQAPSASLFGTLAVVKVSSALAVGLVILAGRRRWRVGRGTLPTALLVGVLDIAGNALFVLAAQVGRLDIAATLSSLYPVVTVILAATLLHERITRPHWLGIALAAIAIPLVASGSGA